MKLTRIGSLIGMLKRIDVSRLKDSEVRKQVHRRCVVLGDVVQEVTAGDLNGGIVEQKRKVFVERDALNTEWLVEDTWKVNKEKRQVNTQSVITHSG